MVVVLLRLMLHIPIEYRTGSSSRHRRIDWMTDQSQYDGLSVAVVVQIEILFDKIHRQEFSR